MKQFIWIVSSSILSALLALILYTTYFQPSAHHSNISPSPHPPRKNVNFELDLVHENYSPHHFVHSASKGIHITVFVNAIQRNKFNKNSKRSNGSGVIISPDGYIITSNHVIKEADDIEITLEDNRVFEAKLIGQDNNTDLALLKIETNNLEYAKFGNSDSLMVGEWVLAVGSPFRLQSTVTAGIVSAKGRNLDVLNENNAIESFIQTDAVINPGNSGGALLNTNSELIGINAVIMTTANKYQGYSFAIPSNLVQKVIHDLKTYGAVQRGWVGMTVTNLDQTKSKILGLNITQGVFVELVHKDGSAFEADLKEGDVIINVDKISVKSSNHFAEILERYSPGDKIQVEIIRNQKKIFKTIILKNHINTTDYTPIRQDKSLTDLGVECRDLSSAELNRLPRKGIYIVSVSRNSIIGKTNMDPGYIVTHINGKRIKTANELIEYLQKPFEKIVLEGFYEHYPGNYPYVFYR